MQETVEWALLESQPGLSEEMWKNLRIVMEGVLQAFVDQRETLKKKKTNLYDRIFVK